MECPKKIAEDDLSANLEYYTYTETKPVFFLTSTLGHPKSQVK
jgi:hypothetical protein